MVSRGSSSSQPAERPTIEAYVSQLVTISRSEEACRLLGVEGVLVDQVDITFLEDAMGYVAYDVAAAIRDSQEGSAVVQATMLSTLVAELRLFSLISAHLDQNDLVERVARHLEEGLS